jgi:hypothetical protein
MIASKYPTRRRSGRFTTVAALLIAALPVSSFAAAASSAAQTILFIGNSFTFGANSPVHFFHPERVTDLNHEGTGGVPALFKTFTTEAGLRYDVSLETSGGKNFDWHLANRAGVINRPWDVVVAQGYSTLDATHPGDPALLVRSTKELAGLLAAQNQAVRLWLVSTWSRADQTYPEKGHWHGRPIEQMALDLRAGYDRAAATSPVIRGVVPVGQAWNRAVAAKVADPNPYDGVAFGLVDLWSWDHYHASAYGYYLEALMVFGKVTGLDPRSLGRGERAALELGMSGAQATALQQIASDELQADAKH